jgi:DNA polymerase III subunit delta'
MSPARKIVEADEPDRIEGFPHPRETYDLMGQDEALTRVARSIRGRRPPQALMIAGPPGIGKATLGYRIARYLLRHGATADGAADLSIPASDVVSRQVEAQSHPGLLVLRRPGDEKTGKLKTVIGVNEIRRLGPFFGMTSASGSWRVALIDSADEMNDNAANALLKILEEPPPRATLILIAHAPGKQLPTIRSRCQRLDLKPLDETVLAAALKQRLPEIRDEDRAVLVRLAEGSLGLALRLSDEDGLALARSAEALLETRAPDYKTLLAVADRVARAQDGLLHFGAYLAQALSRRIRSRAEAGQGDERAVALWQQIGEFYERALEVYLDPRQTVLSSAATIAGAKRSGAI